MSEEEIQKPKIDPRVFLPLDHHLRNAHNVLTFNLSSTNDELKQTLKKIDSHSLLGFDFNGFKKLRIEDYQKGFTFDDFVNNLSIANEYFEGKHINLSGWVFPKLQFHYKMYRTDISDEAFYNLEKLIQNPENLIERSFVFRGTSFQTLSLNFLNDRKHFSFTNNVLFDKANFCSYFDLNCCSFKDISFIGSRFIKDADFRNVKFHKAVFSYAQFEGTLTFDTCQFNSSIDFNYTYFKNTVELKSLEGNGSLKFKEIKLEKNARIIFKNLTKDSPQIIFEDCQFEKNQVIFRNCDMSMIQVERGTYEGFKFEACNWKEEKPPSFKFLKVRNDGHDPNEQKTLKQQEEKYASLKIAAKNSGDEQLASEFHFWQLFYAGKQLKFGIPKIINWIYKVFCAYGLSVTRPLIGWIVFLYFFGVIYSLFLPFSCDPKQNPIVSLLFSFHSSEAMSLSLTASAEVFKITNNYPNNLVQFLLAVQKAIQLFLLFEFGAAIRNRVKK